MKKISKPITPRSKKVIVVKRKSARDFFVKEKKNVVTPFTSAMTKKKGNGFIYNGQEFVHHTDLGFIESAFKRFSKVQSAVLSALFVLLLIGLFVNWLFTLILLTTITTTLYFCDLLFNLFLVHRSYLREPEIKVSKKEMEKVKDSEWPMYTIMCPLYKEWEVLPQFVSAMKDLDYPKNKLQVMLLLEENDEETVRRAKAMGLPKYFDIIVVPHSQPKTKPKALNYGIDLAKGEYIVIYDAEDIPERTQLKKTVIAFQKADTNVICIQAKLNFYNAKQNVLTRLFTLEYSLWFDLVLTGLQSIHAPIPLGGTSNHFRKVDITMLGKWDPFNVTEDADLGMRIIKRGYHTALVDSYTLEEANSESKNWFKQRSRWIKGYIQTYFVHMRKPQQFFSNWKNPHFITFQLVIGGKVLSMLINPFLWVMTIAYFVFSSTIGSFIDSLYLTPVFYMGMFSLVIGNFLYMYYYVLGAAKREQWELIPFAILTPLYWLGMSAAAVFALWEFIVKPHYWHKTQHGLHLKQKEHTLPVFGRLQPKLAYETHTS